MTTERKTSSATEQQADRVKAQFEADRDANGSADSTTHREQKRNAELSAVRAALQEGEASGKPQPFDAEALKYTMLKALELQTRLQN
ncbi:type II toxin-antitoxin system ParD family antitoxin [Pseudomonas sp. Sample_9]|jgi:antitoxin ParD1/3/4|uniref:type II toxin-antitoxin system ParD family antitoxin n=1 Tax=Pseudomonas sp. Sample_9 TaxID=2382158 RepID=UPI001032E466|nr:type II toxin-antitoxin system ParD family antitoxin [Pseudomonas sp. Sample_9]